MDQDTKARITAFVNFVASVNPREDVVAHYGGESHEFGKFAGEVYDRWTERHARESS